MFLGKKHLVHPLDISGEQVHRWMQSGERNFNDTLTNVMFTRDPFTKIFSAHIDKCFVMGLPRLSTRIHKQRNFTLGLYYNRTLKILKAIPKEFHLNVLNITFSDTIQYATGTFCSVPGLRPPKCPESHFHPVSHYCDVCNSTFDIVGKMETFNADVEFYLNSINRTDVYEAMGNVDKNNAVEIVTDVITRISPMVIKRLILPEDAFCDLLYRRTWKVDGNISRSFCKN